MESRQIVRTRGFSFAIPALMDGGLQFVQVSLPILFTVGFGVDPLFVGTVFSVAQAVRFPITLGAGTFSERVGRTRVIFPATFLMVISCVGLALARDENQAFVVYILLMSSIGAFYPAFQAFIGERSPQGQLRKNLSAFNIGWTVGGSLCGLGAGYLLMVDRALPYLGAAVFGTGVILVVLVWARSSRPSAEVASDVNGPADQGPGPLLFISRMGHFLGFFGYAAFRTVFPKLGMRLGYDEGEMGFLLGFLLVGQALGIFMSSAGPWWRGKLWPQLLAQGIAVVSGLCLAVASSRFLFAAAFLVQGVALSIAYTAALYYGLQARTNMGRNTGIHESLVAAGNIVGSFVAGAVAQYVGLRAPYLVFAGLSGIGFIASAVSWRSRRLR